MNTTITADNSTETADAVNAAFAAGTVTTVNGRKVKSFFGGPVARSWGNGTVSVTVAGRERRARGEVFVKVGQVMTAE